MVLWLVLRIKAIVSELGLTDHFRRQLPWGNMPAPSSVSVFSNLFLPYHRLARSLWHSLIEVNHMNRFRVLVWLAVAVFIIVVSLGYKTVLTSALSPTATVSGGIQVEPFADYQADTDCASKVREMRTAGSAAQPLYERYRDLGLIDSHNHGATNPLVTLSFQELYHVARIVLFGAISEPAAVITDKIAFSVYEQHPDKVYPFFAGIPLQEGGDLTQTLVNLEQGYLGIGEIVGASSVSPMTSHLPWKAQHPNTGNLPTIYRLSAEYRVPVLLHIDPPDGEPIRQLENALIENPHTIIIFGHANAYNPPQNIEKLVSKYPNLYIDFFAGFTAYNPDSTNTLADFVPLIEKYSDRFMVSTDSGYSIGQEKAILAMYQIVDLLTPETACKVARQNAERIMESQLPTKTQIARILDLSRQAGEQGVRRLNKRMANELIFALQEKLHQ
jgi:hypothetical protein